MPVVGPRPQVVHVNLDQPCIARFLDHAVLEGSPEKLGKNRHDVKLHCCSSNPSGNSTRMVFDATSITLQIDRANGIKISWPSAVSTFKSGAPPYASTSVTTPTSASPTTLQPTRSA